VATTQTAAVIDGVHTDFVLSSYGNMIMIVVTQLGKMGTILQARQESALDGEVTYTVDTLLGKRDEPLLHACARRVAQLAGERGQRRPVVLTLGLKSHTAQTMKAIVEHIDSNKIW